ncbi:unnamed protein product [Rotaria magnacalcarata]|uniref:Uncharacterized protein n=1 Tax=Rotaria magnacalcarata TaxID=392030 RepID=A0A816T278_9BILA|nr:unnamed protein product [Rotaria magnacalcarata]
MPRKKMRQQELLKPNTHHAINKQEKIQHRVTVNHRSFTSKRRSKLYSSVGASGPSDFSIGNGLTFDGTLNDNTVVLPSTSSKVHYIQLNETICSKYGFLGASQPDKKTCSAWDKALYYFSKLNTYHKFVWFVESDVLIPSSRAFFALHELYSTWADLVSGANGVDVDGTLRSWALWQTAVDTFIPPWSFSMVSAVGCSRRLLSMINQYVAWRGQLPYIEVLFQTIAVQNAEIIRVTPFELSTIKYRIFFNLEQLEAKPNNWWHPVKNPRLKKIWRQKLFNITLQSATSKLNTISLLNSIETHVFNKNTVNTTFDLENYLTRILVQFELEKARMSSFDRRQLRIRFIRLGNTNRSRLNETMLLLAEQAFASPSRKFLYVTISNHSYCFENIHIGFVQPPVSNDQKTWRHLELEKKLEGNKRMVVDLIKGKSTRNATLFIKQLRNEAIRLIHALTTEIQAERKSLFHNELKSLDEINSELQNYSSTRSTAFTIVILLTVIIASILVVYSPRRVHTFANYFLVRITNYYI